MFYCFATQCLFIQLVYNYARCEFRQEARVAAKRLTRLKTHRMPIHVDLGRQRPRRRNQMTKRRSLLQVGLLLLMSLLPIFPVHGSVDNDVSQAQSSSACQLAGTSVYDLTASFELLDVRYVGEFLEHTFEATWTSWEDSAITDLEIRVWVEPVASYETFPAGIQPGRPSALMGTRFSLSDTTTLPPSRTCCSCLRYAMAWRSAGFICLSARRTGKPAMRSWV